MTLRTPGRPRALLAVRNLVPLCLLALITTPIPAARAQEQLWITQFGTSGQDFACALVSDGAGGVIVAGSAGGSRGGPSAGDSDVYVARYDSVGNQIWIRQFGTRNGESAFALSPDGAGGVMVAGRTSGSLGGPNAGPSWTNDAFLARYDGAGNQLWIRQFGTSDSDSAGALAPDGAGGVFVTGSTVGSLGGPNAGSSDVFLARYDGTGNRLWIRQFGTSAGERAKALASDGAGGVMVAGHTHGSLGGPNAGNADVFLARYDSDGNRLWIRQFGTSEFDQALALAPDGAGGVIIAGLTRGSLGGPNAGGHDVLLVRYDSAGNQLWINQFGTSEWERALALSPDGAGGVMVAGWTQGSLGGPSVGGHDAWLARYDGAGDQLWIRQFGTSEGEQAYALALDGVGGVMVAGGTGGSLGGPNAGFWDAFLARYEIDSCPCACDFDTSTGAGVCDIIDFVTFAGLFAGGDPCACDIDTSTGPGVCDIIDFVTFAGQFAAGCP